MLFQEGRVLELEHSRQFSIGALRSGLPGAARTEVLFAACRCWVAYSQAYYSVRSAGAPWEAVPVSASPSCWEPLLIELIGCFLVGRGGWPLAIDLPKLWPSYRHRPPVLLPPLELGLFLLDELVHNTSTSLRKYGYVCCERDVVQFEASATRRCAYRRGAATKKWASSRRNPLGEWGLWAISSSLVLDDASSSPLPPSSTSPHKPHPQTYSYFPQRGTSSSGKWLTGDVKMSCGQLGGMDCIPEGEASVAIPGIGTT